MLRKFLKRQRISVSMIVACACFANPDIGRAQTAPSDPSVIPFNELAGKDQAVVAEVIQTGDSSRKQRQESLKSLPMSRLTPEGQAAVQEICNNLSLFRRMPTVAMNTDRRTYDYFIQNPDVAVSMWRAMDISQVLLNQTGPTTYQTDTKDGTAGTVEVLLRTPDHTLILCQGQLHGAGLPRPIQAKALMHLQARTTGKNQVTHHCDLYVMFPSQAVETLAKLVSPMSFKIADRNFEEISLFVSLMSNAMVAQPGWVEQIALRMEGVAPEKSLEVRSLTAAVYVDNERNRLQREGRPVTLENLIPNQRPPRSAVVPTSGVTR